VGRGDLVDGVRAEPGEHRERAPLVALAVVTVFTTLGKNISGVINNLASYIK